MSHLRAPGAAQEQSRRVIDHLLGSSRPGRVLLVIATLVSLGWFSDSLFEWLTDLDHWCQGNTVADWWPLHRLIGVFTFITIITALWANAAGARKRYRPRIASDPQPAAVKALVLYLSALPSPLADNDLTPPTNLQQFRERQGDTSWRMPVEAIAHHLPRLQRVVLISSSGKHGSHAQGARFKQLCNQLFGNALQVDDIAALDNSWSGGIDFNDVERLTHATDDAHRLLEQGGLNPRDILIDVTGGQKTNSIAGAAVALAEGRTIQYVAFDRDQHSYRVIAYDVTYDR